jgi:putative membrane protein
MSVEGSDSEGRAQWPPWVYGVGERPDHRFSLANERTFLAWVRTSLALLAGGVALDAVELDGPGGLQSVLAVTLVALGLFSGAASWLRWAAAERAMRLRRPLPSTGALAWLALVLVLVAAGLVVLVL